MASPVDLAWWSRAAGVWTLAADDLEALGQGEIDPPDLGLGDPDAGARLGASNPAPGGGWRASVEAVRAAREAEPGTWAPYLFGDLGAAVGRDLADLARWRETLAADSAWAPDESPDPGAVLAPREAAARGRAAAVESSGVRVVAHGIDTLHLSSWCPVSEDARRRLDGLRGLAEAHDVVIGSGDLRWSLAPHGRPGGYRYLLDGPACAVALRGRDLDGQPSAFVEIRAGYLWRLGPVRAVARILEALRAWAPRGAEWPPRVTVSRIDLAADVQGWQPSGVELTAPIGTAPAWVSRTVSRTRSAEPVKGGTKRARDLGADALHLRGRRFTGYSFGAGDLLARIYDKTAEIRKSGKRWCGAIWLAGGADPSLPVWRVEYQLRGDTLRELVIAVTDPRLQAVAACVTDWGIVRQGLDGLWSYLTTREAGRGWLDLRRVALREDGTPDPAAVARARDLGRFDQGWVRDPAWVAISALRWGPESAIARAGRIRAASARQAAAAADPAPTDSIPPLRPADDRGAPDPVAIVREAGRPGTVSALAACRDLADGTARALAASLQVETATERAERLAPQLRGTLAAFAAAVAAARGLDAPATDAEARALLLAAADLAICEGSAASLDAPPPPSGLAQVVRAKSARNPTAAAVRRDLRAASGVWRRR